MEINVNTYQGLNTDAAYDTITSQFYVDALDIRITTTKGESTGAFTNIKGTKEYFEIPADNENSTGNDFGLWAADIPEIIGVTSIRNKIIIFVADETEQKGWIYSINYNEADQTLTGLNLIYYNPNLGFSKKWPIEAISRFESTTVQRIYWTDYNNYLRSLNIVDTNITSLTLDVLDSFPNVKYPLPVLVNILGGGNIPVGLHQFAFKLRSADGKETLISPPSDMIHVTDLLETLPNTSEYTGAPEGTFAQKSLVISIDTSNFSSYKEIILYNIFYSDYNNPPVVKEVETKDVVGNSVTFTYTGQEEETTVISNFVYQLKSYPFKTCKTLTQKDNSLVIANLRYAKFSIKEYLGNNETFDSRMIRYNSSGIPKFPNTTEANKLANAFNASYNKDAHWLQTWRTNEQYKYQSNGARLGGEGPNIKFNFTLDKFVLDFQVSPNRVPIVGPFPDYFDHRYNPNQQNNADSNKTYPNTASPYLSGVFRGFKRGETYRFGIVFYNKKGEASFVNFIGDIKFPDISEPDSINNESGTPYWPISTEEIKDGSLRTMGYTMGIEFAVDFSTCPTLYANIESFQIVRVQRTEKDKRRLTSGYMFEGVGQGIGPVDPGLGFDFHVPGQPSNDSILHINTNGTISELKSNSPSIGHGYGCFCSPELSYGWEGLDNISDSIPNACFLITGGIKEKYTFQENSDQTSGNLAKFSSDIRISYSYNLFTDIFNPSNTNYSKNYIRKISDKSFKRMTDTTDLISSVVGPYNNTYIRNYFAVALSSNDLNNPSPALGTNDGLVSKHASGLLYRTTILTNDPITNTPLSGSDIAVSNNFVPNLLLPAEESTTLAITDYLAPKEEVYGGFTQSALEANTFIQTSPVFSKDWSTGFGQTVKVFGGDTFVSMYVLQKNTYALDEALYKNSGSGAANRGYFSGMGRAFFIPCESNINIELAYGSTVKYNSKYTPASASQPETLYLQENLNSPIMQARSTNMYSYNEVYSREDNTITFFVQPITQATLGITGTNDVRAFISNVKVNEEKIDSWTKFGANNFYDIDDYGPINKIINWKDNVFFFQDRAFGIYAINRAAITTTNDGVPTQLGTGEGFGKHQYYSKESGSIHQYGIVSTDRGIYFFDAIHNKLMLFSEGNNALSELKGIHSLLQKLPKNIFYRKENGGDNSILFNGVNFTKDFVNDEVLFSFVSKKPILQLTTNTDYSPGDIVYWQITNMYGQIIAFGYEEVTVFFDTDGITGEQNLYDTLRTYANPIEKEQLYDGMTLVYDELMGQFSSRYSAIPQKWLENGDILLSANPQHPERIYIHNKGNWGEIYDTTTECFVKLIVNPKADINKILRTLEFNSIVRDNNKVIDRDITITAFRIETEIGDTGKVLFSPLRFKRRFDKWRLKIPRDLNSINQQGRLRSTHFIVTLYFDNEANKELIMNRLLSYYDVQIF